MTTLEIVLSIWVYLLMAFISYKPFKKISENGYTDHPAVQIFIWPAMWFALGFVALLIGLRFLLKNKK